MVSDLPNSERQASLLRASSFGTLSDVHRFLEWYEAAEHHSGWDETRCQEAKEIFACAPDTPC